MRKTLKKIDSFRRTQQEKRERQRKIEDKRER